MKSSTDGNAPEEAAGGAGPGTLARVATGLRLRGAGGRLTATLVRGGIDQFRGREWVLVGRGPEAATRYGIEEYTIYGRRIALKLRGVDSAAGAQPLVGADILLPCNGLVDLPEGAYYIFNLVGLRVRTAQGRDLGRVRAVIETGGTPLLEIEPNTGAGASATGGVILIPASRSICKVIDPAAGSVLVDPPDGLLELYGF